MSNEDIKGSLEYVCMSPPEKNPIDFRMDIEHILTKRECNLAAVFKKRIQQVDNCNRVAGTEVTNEYVVVRVSDGFYWFDISYREVLKGNESVDSLVNHETFTTESFSRIFDNSEYLYHLNDVSYYLNCDKYEICKHIEILNPYTQSPKKSARK